MKKMSLRAKIGSVIFLLLLLGLYFFDKVSVLHQLTERHPVGSLIGITLLSAITSLVTGAMYASNHIKEKSLSEWRSEYTLPHLIIEVVMWLAILTALCVQQYASYWQLFRIHHTTIQDRGNMLPFLAISTYFLGFFLGYGLIFVRRLFSGKKDCQSSA